MDRSSQDVSSENVDVPNPRQQLMVLVDRVFDGITWTRSNVSLLHYLLLCAMISLAIAVFTELLSDGSLKSAITGFIVGLVAIPLVFWLDTWLAFRRCVSCERVVPLRLRRIDGFYQDRICHVCREALLPGVVVGNAKAALEANWNEWKNSH